MSSKNPLALWERQAPRGQELPVERVDVVDEPLDLVARECPLAAGAAQLGAKLRVAREPLERGRDPLDVADRHEEAVGAVLTTSGTPPTRVATTGVPAASDSIATTGVPSFPEGSSSTSNRP